MNDDLENLEEQDIIHLESFIYENGKLEEIEESFDKFNIFTALKIVNQEIRHSNFLGWLLDPQETHGIGDYFLKKFVKEVHYKFPASSSFTIFDLDSLNFDKVEVRREWRNIDVLILDSKNKYYWLIENKIKSGESKGQLNRYKEIVELEWPDFNGTLIYLTVDGYLSSENDYLPIGYDTISVILEKLILSKRDKIAADILAFISQYNQMLKIHVMNDSRIQGICKEIYKNHSRALDLIFEYKPDDLLDINQILKEYIRASDELILEDSNKAYIRFTTKNLAKMPKKGHGWVTSNNILVFEFRNYDKNLSLYLIIGPGDENIRVDMYNAVHSNRSKLFTQARKEMSKRFYSVYKKEFLKGTKRKEIEYDQIKNLVISKFDKFIQTDLPLIEDNFNEKIKVNTQ